MAFNLLDIMLPKLFPTFLAILFYDNFKTHQLFYMSVILNILVICQIPDKLETDFSFWLRNTFE